MAKTKKGLYKVLGLVAGLFIGGLAEQHLMSKISFLANTKSATDGTTTKNTLGIILKTGLYVVGGLVPSALTDNEMIEYAGYGFSAYGGLQGAKGMSDKAKVYGLGGMYPHVNLIQQPYQNYLEGPGSNASSM